MTRVRDSAEQIVKSCAFDGDAYHIRFVSGALKYIPLGMFRGYKKPVPGTRIVCCANGCNNKGKGNMCRKAYAGHPGVECHEQFLRVVPVLHPESGREKYNTALKREQFLVTDVRPLCGGENPRWRVQFLGGRSLCISRSEFITCYTSPWRGDIKPGQYILPCNIGCNGNNPRCANAGPDCMGKYYRRLLRLKYNHKKAISRL